ncbi:MAG: hypothetical protein OXO49_09385 [Gammaproteobacteria bacterium]|nr:hypothetical protein [Gammaproteobacteria bacterium]MDE0252794.1 hypothetical protein [Gammaproteobacteria bacterium]MDE0402197.1 hypothetical protein [Gammaproteobacteria bacterium]
MNICRVFVPLFLLLTVFTYADNRGPVVGYDVENCDGDWVVWAASLNALYEYNKKHNLKSYTYTSDSSTCYVFEEEVVATGTPEPSTGEGSGGGGSLNGGGRNGQGDSGQAGQAPNPADEFDNEANETLKDCLVGKLAKLDVVKNWEGEYTEATWENDTDEEWLTGTHTGGLLGGTYVQELGEEIVFETHLYPHNILNIANKYDNVSFDHLVWYTQMHELVHVMQRTHDKDDEGNLIEPDAAESFTSFFLWEMEAYRIVEEWWDALFGGEPPFMAPDIEKPDDFDDNKTRYEELYEKKQNGTLVVDPDADPPIDEVKELEELTTYFENKKKEAQLVHNEDYDGENVSLECEEEEESE